MLTLSGFLIVLASASFILSLILLLSKPVFSRTDPAGYREEIIAKGRRIGRWAFAISLILLGVGIILQMYGY